MDHAQKGGIKHLNLKFNFWHTSSKLHGSWRPICRPDFFALNRVGSSNQMKITGSQHLCFLMTAFSTQFSCLKIIRKASKEILLIIAWSSHYSRYFRKYAV